MIYLPSMENSAVVLLLLLVFPLHLELKTGKLFFGAHFHELKCAGTARFKLQQCEMVVWTNSCSRAWLGSFLILSLPNTLWSLGKAWRVMFLTVTCSFVVRKVVLYHIRSRQITCIQGLLFVATVLPACSTLSHLQLNSLSSKFVSSSKASSSALENWSSELVTCSICV